MTEDWTRWEGHTINGVLPLRRFLGGTEHSGVYLTQFAAQNLPAAAVKLVPASRPLAEEQLAQWRFAATLSHPHLIRILDSGRCQLGEDHYFFEVMELAEQDLAHIIARRALTADEVRELLVPTLDALSFLHRRGLSHGRLRPSNILAIDDQLKLSSDTVCAAGPSALRSTRLSAYESPESVDGSSAAGDIWSLGVTIVEALTQKLPAWPNAELEDVSLPATLPPMFVGVVRRCLSRSPANRPTVAELASPIKPADSTDRPPSPAATPAELPRQRPIVPAIALILAALIAAWAGLRLLARHSNSPQSAPSSSRAPLHEQTLPANDSRSVPSALSNLNVTASGPPPTRSASGPSDHRPQRSAGASHSVLHEELPTVSRTARETIRGHLRVAVRVTVAPSGDVVDESLEEPGPSRYFAARAIEAARRWKFAPANNPRSRNWLLRFEFTRDGTTVHATSPWS